MFQQSTFRLPPHSFLNWFFLSLFLFCSTPQSVCSQNLTARETPEIAILELSKPIERELSGGQKHDYQITLEANQYARVTVEQRSIDVATLLQSADGKMSVDNDTDPRKQGRETVEFTAKNSTVFTLTVRSRQNNAPLGRYEIKVEELRPASQKDFALDEARQLSSQANRLWRLDKYDEALALAQRSLAIREKELSADNPDIGTSLFIIANQYNDKADYPTAEPLYQRALSIKEKALGKENSAVASILNNLGNLYRSKGDYVKAESLYRRVLEIREKTLEPTHLLIATVLTNLANISSSRGDIEKAAAYYQRSLEIREKALGPEHPDVANNLNNIANLYYYDVAKAEPLYRRALAIQEKALGVDNPSVAQTLYNMSLLYQAAGDSTKALPLCQRALTISEKALGAEHPQTSYVVNLLAAIYQDKGDYIQAESLYQRAIAIREKTQSEYHPNLGGVYMNLAYLSALKGEIDKAIQMQARANKILEFNIGLNLTIGGEKEKLDYIESVKDLINVTLTLNSQYAPNSEAATDLGAEIILQRKGRIQDAVSDDMNALRRRLNSQDQLLLDNLNKITKQLAELITGGTQAEAIAEYQAKVKALTAHREKLEDEISRRATGFYAQAQPVTVAAIQKLIPRDSALVEFATYAPILSKKAIGDNKELGDPRYGVYVLHNQGAVRWKELGDAKQIDAAINDFRRALSDPKRKDVEQLARALNAKVMQPVGALLGDATHLLVSPDGALNLIPFEALVNEQGHYLIENYSFTYLTSGRDLLRMQTPRDSKSKFLIIANPSFGEPVLDQSATDTTTRTNKRNGKRSVTAASDLSETYFAPLGATAQEARSIRDLFPEATILTGAQATETALKHASAPSILHIATHGFFLQNNETNLSSNLQTAPNGSSTNTQSENPLLRSGLALAGANGRRRGLKIGDDDGILTALEASGLNLWGTKLVVLSACDTGLGEVRNGEGVYGLRRALVLAGTESLVMSLWAVSDYTTRELMTNYYQNLKQGMGRSEALRQVQLEMLKRSERRHPFYWASFIQSGEWANLDNQRR